VQYDPPETLLSAPSDAFVKKFVGLDRALKRLSRLSARDFVRPVGTVTTQAGPETLEEELRRMEERDCARYLWVTDEDGRLVGWIDGQGPGGGSMEEDLVEVDPGDSSVRQGYSLKQALSMFVQQGVVCLPVVDERHKLTGEIRLADILES
jgi:osmoprotectant transport system ATP-binding protein